MERRTNNINMGGDSNNNSDDEDHGNEEKQKNTQEMLASLGPQVSFSSFHFLVINQKNFR